MVRYYFDLYCNTIYSVLEFLFFKNPFLTKKNIKLKSFRNAKIVHHSTVLF